MRRAAARVGLLCLVLAAGPKVAFADPGASRASVGLRWVAASRGQRPARGATRRYARRTVPEANRAEDPRHGDPQDAPRLEILRGGRRGVTARRLLELSHSGPGRRSREIALMRNESDGMLLVTSNLEYGVGRADPDHSFVAHTHPGAGAEPGNQMPSRADILSLRSDAEDDFNVGFEAIVSDRGVVIYGPHSSVRATRYTFPGTNRIVETVRGRSVIRIDSLDVHLGLDGDGQLVVSPTDGSGALPVTFLSGARVGLRVENRRGRAPRVHEHNPGRVLFGNARTLSINSEPD